ncbi:helix-turn-helix domain-containing protein [Streptococcus sanguinis]|uniref:helix-turn-helix domain-containing protein n=1 Tax=Streptococcus sanguinis TaxID=1305 RepID=UPI000F68B9DB|nr:helix-turn-helix transcriptional regulator [Streptococcus sanguinis]RSI51558.1 Helix-turn-helix domain protein [Streptococcus sanguinis]
MKLRLKELRKARGISASQLGIAVGIPGNTIFVYERKGIPTFEKAEKIADYFGVNPAYLVGWIDESSKPEKVIETVEKVVTVPSRIPSYYQQDENGNHINWRQFVRLVPKAR